MISPSERRIIWEMSDEDEQKLLAIAQEHVKLGLENIQPQTSKERREAIMKRILMLKEERKSILHL